MYKLLLSLLAAVCCLPVLSRVGAAEANENNLDKNREQKYSHGVLIRLEGTIGPMLAAYFERKLALAEAEGADLIILEIDSPGGTLAETLDMAERLRDLNFAHTVAYIPKHALSGGAIVALGCDEIIMDPKALIGDAGPIFQDEDRNSGSPLKKSSAIWPRWSAAWRLPKAARLRWPRPWSIKICKYFK